MMNYCPRLIEVDLPIRRISAHARREKSIRHGHISTLHVWFARRPLAACRAVICAALWPDPADERSPRSFRVAAGQALIAFAEQVRGDINLLNLCSKESAERWMRTNEHTWAAADTIAGADLRYALLDFIADFANWDASAVPAYLKTARIITQAAHEALGGEPGTRPLVVDPFAGGGAIPLEALRVGADVVASDLNPIPVLLNKVTLEYIPRYGRKLAEAVRYWGQWVKTDVEKKLAEFYPRDPNGAIPIAYLWARTIICEGPGCGVELPLVGQVWLSKDEKEGWAFSCDTNANGIALKPIRKPNAQSLMQPISRGSAATCPICDYTTPAKNVRNQLFKKHGGSDSAKLLAVVTKQPGQKGRSYRSPNSNDFAALENASKRLEFFETAEIFDMPLIPHESCPPEGQGHRI